MILKDKLWIAGANELIASNEIASLEAVGYIETPIAYEAIDDLLVDAKGALMSEVEIFKGSIFIDQTLDKIDFDRFHINFIGIMHSDNKHKFIFNPKRDETILKEKDFLIIIGFERTISEFKTYIRQKDDYNIWI